MSKVNFILKSFGVLVAGCVLVLACILGFSNEAQALDKGPYKWTVTYNADKQMVSNYDKAQVDELLSDLQPGDSFTMSATLKNDSAASTDWYMASEVLETLEENSKASDGAYTYKLTFNGNVIYDSQTVGGDGANGFEEIAGATSEWFALGAIESGATGSVKIEMSLDGETQTNVYMNTVGRLNVVFAVEDSGSLVGGTLTKTNDPLTLMVYAVGIVAAIACIAYSLVSLRKLHKGRDAQ